MRLALVAFEGDVLIPHVVHQELKSLLPDALVVLAFNFISELV